jgi:spore coat protein CotH
MILGTHKLSIGFLASGLFLLGCGNSDPSGSSSAAGGTSFGGTSFGVGGGASQARGGGNYVEPVEVVDMNATPAGIVALSLTVAQTEVAKLEANPFSGPDVVGAFTDELGTKSDPINVNYRGAYALQTLINGHVIQRNWKLKFAQEQPYHNRREWNFNYEPHIRQRLAYLLMRLAGVKVPTARHVVLSVNGTVNGLYLEYEDPDNKAWLFDKFGDDSGDLYKAGYDIPNQPRYFATLEVLGTLDSDYAMHYRKKTNDDDPIKATDYSALRTFISDFNTTPDSGFEAFLRSHFEVDRFIDYLVVANFVSHWDSYPQRPKNYWLYQVPATGKWNFIPWDLDATFQPYKNDLNPMGTDASVLYQFDRFVDYRGRLPEEGTNRPLVTRVMKVPAFRAAYIARYKTALTTFLAKDYLLAQVAKLQTIIAGAAQANEMDTVNSTRKEIEDFITARSASVSSELAGL